MAEPEIPEPVVAEVSATVGQRLRTAREAMQLSVQDVAQSLKYSARQIELIEADNYAALPGITVVRGFVRSYARLLRLDGTALIEMLDERLPRPASDVRPPDNMGEASEPGGPKQFPAIVAAAIVLLLAALLLALWHYFGPPPARSTVGVNGAPVVSPVASAEPAPAVLPAAAPVAPATDGAAQNSPVGGAETKDGLVPQLVFVFEGRSWIEVMDGTRKLIHTGENPAGSQLKLNGQPPFDIVVGNAARVKLSYGDRVVDLTPHTRAEVARLKLE